MTIKSVLCLILTVIMVVVLVSLASAVTYGTVHNLTLAATLIAIAFFGAPFFFGLAVSVGSVPNLKTYLKLLGAWILILSITFLLIFLVGILVTI